MMKKKILYVDLFSPRGHYNFNKIYLKAINNIPDVSVDVLFAKDFIEGMELERSMYVNSYVYNEYNSRKTDLFHKILWRIYQFSRLFYCKRLIRKNKYDYVFFSTFDEVTFSMMGVLKRNVIAVYHQDANHLLSSSLIIRCMQYIAKRVHVIALNKAYSELLNKEGIRNIFVPHGFLQVNTDENKGKRSIFVPINDAVDLDVVQKLVSADFSNLLMKLNVTMTIKNISGLSNEFPNINITERYIPKEDYNRLFATSELILLPYDRKEYRYRTSAMLFEAIANQKYVAIPNAEAFLSLKNSEDTGMFMYNSIQDFYQYVEKMYDGDNIPAPKYDGIMAANGIKVITETLKFLMDEK